VKRVEYPPAIRALIGELKRMPGIGPRSAERIALWMVQARDARPRDIATAILSMCEQVRACPQCGFFTSEPLCEFCASPDRDNSVICVVEQPTDILPLERTGVFRGRYHSLGGRIAPLDHVGPDDLRIAALVSRVKNERPSEVILALGTDVEGDATSNYIAELLGELPVTISRIAQGLPAGGGLDHADELTLNRALTGRTRQGKPA
jgi:recombination protein RecR